MIFTATFPFIFLQIIWKFDIKCFVNVPKTSSIKKMLDGCQNKMF